METILLLADTSPGEMGGLLGLLSLIITAVIGFVNKSSERKHDKRLMSLENQNQNQAVQMKQLETDRQKCDEEHKKANSILEVTQKKLDDCHEKHEETEKRITTIEDEIRTLKTGTSN